MMTAQKLIDLVLVRNFDNKKLLSYNLVPNSYLFDEEGCMIESGKNVLVREIEKIYISKEGHCFTNSNMFSAFLVDVLSFFRKIDVANCETFGDLCSSVLPYVSSHSMLQLKKQIYVSSIMPNMQLKLRVVFVECIYHISGLKTLGLLELLSRGGAGSTTRYIPVHIIATVMGSSLCYKLPTM